jgi:hypothetical protein
LTLHDYLHSHTSLHDKIEKRTSVVYGIEESSVNSEDSHDDTDIPSSAVIEDALGIAALIYGKCLYNVI